LKAKSSSQMAIISDAIKPAGLGDGDFDVWDERITVRGGRTSLASSKGDTIAGSVITMLDALKNMVGLGVPLAEAVGMASLVPARVAGIDKEFGSIALGKRADLVALDDQLSPILTMIGGEPSGT